MKMIKNHLIMGAICAMAFTTAPLWLSAQEQQSTTTERDTGDEVSDDEQLPNPEDVLHQPANLWPKGSYVVISVGAGDRGGKHLGPTGLWGVPMGQNIRVKEVTPGSPADGKVMPDDVIYAANGKGFGAERDARYYFSTAITEAETHEAGGRLELDILRDGQLIKVPIQLEVMGSFSETTPYDCEKSDKIIARAEEYMLQGLRPESGIPNNGNYMYQPWHDGALFLMASGNPKMQGLVRRHIRNSIDELEEWKAWEQLRGGGFNPYDGWGFAYLQLLFGEYYHLTGDRSVLPYLEAMCTQQFVRDAHPNKPHLKSGGQSAFDKDWTWPPKQPTGYGIHPHAHMAQTMSAVLANEAGLNISQDKLLYDLKYLYVKRAEYGFVGYHGYGAQPIENRQIDQPEVMTPEEKATGTFSAMNGKPGQAAALFSMVDGYEKAVEMCSERSVYAYNRTNKGHGGIFLNGFWTPIGAYHAGPEKYQHFMQGQQWWRELYRNHTGSMWMVGNAKEYKEDTLGTGFAIHRAAPRKNLRILGAPHSMFGPTAPAYMKEALAAHRDRNYTLAEELTLKLQSSGTVPAEDQNRVSHFLKSVRMLKESIEHDLAFAESLLAKQNYILASIELSQLQMVVSPDNRRLQAIAKAVEANRDQIPTKEEIHNQRVAASLKEHSNFKQTVQEGFEKEVASTITLIKDGAQYRAPKGLRKGTTYPTFSKKECTPWRLETIKHTEDPPVGWEQPAFNDSQWKEITLASSSRENHTALLRTNFMVEDVNAFEALRIRGMSRSQSNMTIYLNGEVVAKGAEVPGTLSFDLKPSAIGLLRNGNNTLAISSDRGYGRHAFSIRLDGIRGKRPQSANVPSKPTTTNNKPSVEKNPKTQSGKLPKLKTHHDEIEFMLGHLNKVKPKIKIGEEVFPATEVHDYLAKRYREHKSKVTSTDIFLDKIAYKTLSDLVYYVVDDKGDKTMLKDWLEDSLPAKK